MRGGFGQQPGWFTSKRAKARRAAAACGVYPLYGVYERPVGAKL
jgi:hypothetical protein